MTYRTRSFLATFLGFCFWLGLSYAAAWSGSRFVPGEWYAQLAKPAFTPPDWLFPVVWSILYFLMGVAAFLVWQRQGLTRAFPALAFFVVQLALNASWSWVFFGLHKPGAAFAEILLLWLAILATLTAFWRHRPAAGLLLVPYLLWVSFAALLNYRLWRLNP